MFKDLIQVTWRSVYNATKTVSICTGERARDRWGAQTESKWYRARAMKNHCKNQLTTCHRERIQLWQILQPFLLPFSMLFISTYFFIVQYSHLYIQFIGDKRVGHNKLRKIFLQRYHRFGTKKAHILWLLLCVVYCECLFSHTIGYMCIVWMWVDSTWNMNVYSQLQTRTGSPKSQNERWAAVAVHKIKAAHDKWDEIRRKR